MCKEASIRGSQGASSRLIRRFLYRAYLERTWIHFHNLLASCPSLTNRCQHSVDVLNHVRSLFFRFLGSQNDASSSSCMDQLAIWIVESEKCLKIGLDVDQDVFCDSEVIHKLLRLTDRIKFVLEDILPSANARGSSSVSDNKPIWRRSCSLPLHFVNPFDCPDICAVFRGLRTMFACL
ncbi:hypothetical protein O6H91_07G075900 [Diphasiastrum complanatum]|uniref:Uncharacterized protein n=1 Tax=Diphasiastrum complanatum TaxID=34168 RepID=A0ACC2D6Y2_DIPCM|nr:hypothetical protein O6H91_07G075900 [Diphasiastrum complanatum]